jgi:hypothetical protein
MAGAKPSIVFIGSLAAGEVLAGGATSAGGATGAVDGARGVGSTPGGANPGEKPIIVFSGTRLVPEGAPAGGEPVDWGEEPSPSDGCEAGAGASFTAPHWPQNLTPSGIGCPH